MQNVKALFVLGMLLVLFVCWGCSNRIRINQLTARVEALESTVKAEADALERADKCVTMEAEAIHALQANMLDIVKIFRSSQLQTLEIAKRIETIAELQAKFLKRIKELEKAKGIQP